MATFCLLSQPCRAFATRVPLEPVWWYGGAVSPTTSGPVRERSPRMRKALLIVLATVALLMAASCKSTPPVEPVQPVEPAKPVAAPLPESELAKAKDLKARVDLFKLGPLA